MLDRLRAAARKKVAALAADVVDSGMRDDAQVSSARSQSESSDFLSAAVTTLGEQLDEIGARLDEVTAQLAAAAENTTEMRRRQDELEFRARRDVWYAQDLLVTMESAEFVMQQMPKARVFWDPMDTLRFALDQVSSKGMALEFGVATGATLTVIAERLAAARLVAGFDSFAGLPQTWRTGFEAGQFAHEPPEVPGAVIVAGMFDVTLPGFLTSHDGPIAFLHLDADLYTSTKTVLDAAGDRLAPGAVLVFDEFFNYPGWQNHEARAFGEFIARTGRGFTYLAFTGNDEQVAVRLD